MSELWAGAGAPVARADEGEGVMNELDDAARRAIEAIRFYQDECRRQCAPYVKILADIEAVRPRVVWVEGQMLVPLDCDPRVAR